MEQFVQQGGLIGFMALSISSLVGAVIYLIKKLESAHEKHIQDLKDIEKARDGKDTEISKMVGLIYNKVEQGGK